MNGNILPMALLSASVGLALGFASQRGALLAVAAMIAVAVLVASTSLPQNLVNLVRAGAWLSVVAAAALTFLPRGFSESWTVLFGINSGAWIGALAALSTGHAQLFLILPLTLSFVPAQWLSGKGYAIATRVVLSWIVAVASLAFFVSLMPAAGYQPDHME